MERTAAARVMTGRFRSRSIIDDSRDLGIVRPRFPVLLMYNLASVPIPARWIGIGGFHVIAYDIEWIE